MARLPQVPFVLRLGDVRIVVNPGALLGNPGPGCEVSTLGTDVLPVPRAPHGDLARQHVDAREGLRGV